MNELLRKLLFTQTRLHSLGRFVANATLFIPKSGLFCRPREDYSCRFEGLAGLAQVRNRIGLQGELRGPGTSRGSGYRCAIYLSHSALFQSRSDEHGIAFDR